MAEYLKAGFGLINGLGEEQFEKVKHLQRITTHILAFPRSFKELC